MKTKIFLMLVMSIILTSCAVVKKQAGKFVGGLNGAVQIYERYERVYDKISHYHSAKVSDCGTVVQQSEDQPLESLTWSNMQIERQGNTLCVNEFSDGQFVLCGKYALTENQSKEYDCYIQRNGRLQHYKVVVAVMEQKGYVRLKDENGRVLENYTFE